LNRYREAVNRKSDMRVDVDSLEELFRAVTTTADLSPEHIEALSTNRYMKANFFSFPSVATCLDPLRDLALDMRASLAVVDEKRRISRLLRVIGTLENAGILLSFVDPVNYCMFSGYIVTSFFPVRPQGTLEETYLAFRDDLRHLGSVAGIRRVTDVDRALCALWMERTHWETDVQVKAIKKQFDKDPEIMRLRLERSGVLPLFRKDPLAVAEELLEFNHRVAGKFGREALEAIVYDRRDKRRLNPCYEARFLDKCRDLPELTDLCGELNSAWRTGSECIHPRGRPSERAVRKLVTLARRLRDKSLGSTRS